MSDWRSMAMRVSETARSMARCSLRSMSVEPVRWTPRTAARSPRSEPAASHPAAESNGDPGAQPATASSDDAATAQTAEAPVGGAGYEAAGDPLPEGLALGEECELKDPAEQGAIVKCQRQELQCDEITKHLDSGKQVTRLALNLDDHVSFVLGEDLVVRKFKLLDGAVDQLESSERDDIRAELDARFALMSAEFTRLFTVLEKALKLSRADA